MPTTCAFSFKMALVDEIACLVLHFLQQRDTKFDVADAFHMLESTMICFQKPLVAMYHTVAERVLAYKQCFQRS